MAEKKRRLRGWVFQPMRYTGREAGKAFIKPSTILYPLEKERDEWEALRENFRGHHRIDWNKCIGCRLCSRVCPNQCIIMEDVKVDEGYKGPSRSNITEKKNIIRRPGVDIGRCLFCGNCSEYCPTGAWEHTTKIELTEFTREALVYPAEKLRFEGKPTGELENKMREHPKLDVETCIGCKRCFQECPTRCITMVPGPKMRKDKPIENPQFDLSKCIGCGTCADVCKPESIKLEEF